VFGKTGNFRFSWIDVPLFGWLLQKLAAAFKRAPVKSFQSFSSEERRWLGQAQQLSAR
jgi:hypothetical protein